jgi:hypothetical protein
MIKIEKMPNTKDISEAIKENGGYCICAVEKNQDTRCLCKEFREQKESGICHCGLYKKTVTKD